jgi:cobyrinic acid a,c-diamide synthase
LLVAAPASGQGKTTVVAALARLHTRQGRRVRVFKCGPDFLDPQIHAMAAGSPCENIDFRMCGEADAQWRLARAAQTPT